MASKTSITALDIKIYNFCYDYMLQNSGIFPTLHQIKNGVPCGQGSAVHSVSKLVDFGVYAEITASGTYKKHMLIGTKVILPERLSLSAGMLKDQVKAKVASMQKGNE